ncbi:phage tail protein [Zophobihabitans entericus]|uniref:Phage tail protein n=1 Tax=Zophobihabitans entericus TaxID=1635327 RepID=A0A6G9I9Y2_9GAMM|nr:phage tail protein [Zophobihabitans entericus]QIQ21023.1 phage tail protein [Zophobihabitans entericus]
MEEFQWEVAPDMVVNVSPKVKVVKFGDGYEQRQKSGINHDLRTYNVTIKVKREDEFFIDEFLSRHGAVNKFLWRQPHTHKLIAVVCRNWNISVSNIITTITATFEEVVA